MAIKKDGTVIIDTLIDTKGFNKGVGNMQKSVSGLTSTIGKLGVAIGLAFSVKAVINFGKECINLGSDLQEVQNVVDVTFGNMSERINEFAKNAITQFGLSELAAKQYASTMGAMLKSMGFNQADVLDMSTTLAGLAGDIASFYNLTGDEAFTKIRAGISGETEPLKQLGINLSVANLEAFALAEGITKSYNAMTEQEKAMLRYKYLLKTTADAQGDFARTSDSWANQTRILAEQFNSLKATIGQGLINAFTPVIKMLNTLLAKLQTVANAFKALTEQIFGKQETQQVSKNLSAIEDEYSGIADATNDAKKAQDKYLTGLDEIKTFQTQDAVGAVSAESSAIPLQFEDTEKQKEETSKIATALQSAIEKAKELAQVFKTGFKSGLGDITGRINSIKDSANSIKESLKSIFDSRLMGTFESTILRIVESLGAIAGSFTSIGVTLATNLMGGLSGYLESSKGRIKRYLLEMFDIAGSLSELAAKLMDAFAYIFESLASEKGQSLTENIIAIFADTFMSVTGLAAKFGSDLLSFIIEPFVNSKEAFKLAFDSIISGLEELTGTIRTILQEWFGYLSQIYTENIAPIFESLITEMESLYQEHIAPLLSKLGGFFGEVADNLSALWNDLFKPFIDWFVNNVMPIIAPILKMLLKNFIDTFDAIADIIGGFIDVLSGLISILVGTFTGDWQRVWDGIKSIFTGIWNSLVSVVETFINSSINLINGLIDGVNNLTGAIGIPTIPNISTVTIPKLATGAVIPPNAPFMAVLGDQKHGTNIEAPLDTIKQAVREVVGSNGNGATYHFVAQLNGQTLFEQFVSQAQLNQMATGQNVLVTL